MRIASALALVALAACAVQPPHSVGTPTPLPSIVFRSLETGPIEILDIVGDTPIPWRHAPKRLFLGVAQGSNANAFSRLINSRMGIGYATIDDPGAGELFVLLYSRVTSVAAVPTATAPQRVVVTLTIGRYRLKCGPPTCTRPHREWHV